MKPGTIVLVLIVLALIVAGVGFSRGWFVLSSDVRRPGDDSVGVHLTVNPEKARADARSLKGKAHDLTGPTLAKEPPNKKTNTLKDN